MQYHSVCVSYQDNDSYVEKLAKKHVPTKVSRVTKQKYTLSKIETQVHCTVFKYIQAYRQ